MTILKIYQEHLNRVLDSLIQSDLQKLMKKVGLKEDEEINEHKTSCPNRLDEGKRNENQKRFRNENTNPKTS